MRVQCTVAASRGGAWGGKCPPVGGSAPPFDPPVRRKTWPKSAIFGKFLDFGPLRIAFCPLDAPHKKISGAATGNAQCKLEIPIILHGTWSVGILIRNHGDVCLLLLALYWWYRMTDELSLKITLLNWKYRKIDKWYTNKIVVNCCQINCQTDEISTRSTFLSLLNDTIRIVLKRLHPFICPTDDLPCNVI